MRILVLHNNNIPICLRQGAQGETNDLIQGIGLVHYAFSLPQTDVPDFDTFTCEKLSFLEKEHYDLIILPYSLSETHIEYSGLRVAAHIRLTPKWNSLTTPILFLGIDRVDEIQKLSFLGGILFTNNVYHSDKTGLNELINIFTWIKKYAQVAPSEEIMESQEYQSLLQRLNTMPVPANYATHHSIANKWAIIRWKEMFMWKEGKEPSLPDESFSDMLYFKYLMCSAGQRERYNNRKRKRSVPTSEILNNRRVIYVDDEAHKGWNAILASILSESGAELIPYPFLDSDKPQTKTEMVQDIMSFLTEDYEKNGGADCYIIDLRLHDEDFQETTKLSDLSGHILAEYIVKKRKDKDNNNIKIGLNPYNQIVVFTASNKVWNLKKELLEVGAIGYATKESPEQNLSRDESYQAFSELFSAIKDACSMSYLKDWYNELVQLHKNGSYSENDLSLLYEFISLLRVDNGSNLPEIIRACVVTLYAFFETFLIKKKRFNLTSMDLYKGDISIGNWFKRVFFKTDKDERGKVTNYIDIQCHDHPISTVNPGWEDPDILAKASKILLPLYIYYDIHYNALLDVLQLINERNKGAHEGISAYSIVQFKNVFNHVILPMLKKTEAS